MYTFPLVGNSIVILWFIYLLASCGDANLAESSTENTPDEIARLALEAKDWDQCIVLYGALIADDPTGYQRYPLISTCYAGRAGIDLLNIVRAQVVQGGQQEEGQGGDVFESIGQYVPQDPTDQQLADINEAVSRLEQMPLEHRAKDGAYPYSSEAAFQFDLYLGASSSMFVNKYREVDAEGNVDRERLEEMSDEEVDDLFNNLDSIVEANEAENEGLGENVEATVSEINQMEGATQREKLINYLAQTENQTNLSLTQGCSDE